VIRARPGANGPQVGPHAGSARLHRAGLLLVIPDLVHLDLPALAAAAGYPGTRVIPAVSWLLSLLALKLTRTRRVSHVDDLLADPAAALLAGLATLPKKSNRKVLRAPALAPVLFPAGDPHGGQARARGPDCQADS
jgi:hypothetical protein